MLEDLLKVDLDSSKLTKVVSKGNFIQNYYPIYYIDNNYNIFNPLPDNKILD